MGVARAGFNVLLDIMDNNLLPGCQFFIQPTQPRLKLQAVDEQISLPPSEKLPGTNCFCLEKSWTKLAYQQALHRMPQLQLLWILKMILLKPMIGQTRVTPQHIRMAFPCWMIRKEQTIEVEEPNHAVVETGGAYSGKK